MAEHLNYGNWIRTKNLIILGLLAFGSGLMIFLPILSPYRLPLTFLFFLLLINFLFPLYAYIMFSPRGGRIQEKVYGLVIEGLGEQVHGKLLDIGTGNGVLAVKLAQRYPHVNITAIDYWGEDWEYSQGICERNAQAGGVTSRVLFQKGDAADLDFPAGTFDGAVSNLTFHEVKSVLDKREVAREALRVVKKGGEFSFVDYFYEPRYYGNALEFERYLKDLGLTQVVLEPLHQKMRLNILLCHPRMLGRVGILSGRK